jgi:hypothetical protein
MDPTIEMDREDGLGLVIEPPHLGLAACRRLQRLQAQVDGATQVAQAVINAHQMLRDGYERAFREACEDANVDIPPGPHDVDIDWATGSVRFTPKADA